MNVLKEISFLLYSIYYMCIFIEDFDEHRIKALFQISKIKYKKILHKHFHKNNQLNLIDFKILVSLYFCLKLWNTLRIFSKICLKI